MWRRGTPVEGCTPRWSTVGARRRRDAWSTPLTMSAVRTSTIPVGSATIHSAGPLWRPRLCKATSVWSAWRAGGRPLGCSRCRAWSYPGSSFALRRSAGRRVLPRPLPQAVPSHWWQVGGVAWGTSLPRCRGRARCPRGARAPRTRCPRGRPEASPGRSPPRRPPGGGSLSPPRSPSALMTSCAASSVGVWGPVLPGAVCSAIVVSLCLRAGDGVRTCCGCPAPVAACFVARAVGVVGCGWGSLNVGSAGWCQALLPGSAGRSLACGAVSRPPPSGLPFLRRAASPLFRGGGASRCCDGRLVSGTVRLPVAHVSGRAPHAGPVARAFWAVWVIRGTPPQPNCLLSWKVALRAVELAVGVRGLAFVHLRLPVLRAVCRGPLTTCGGHGCAGVGAQHCPFGLHALWGAARRGVGGRLSRRGWPSTVVRGLWCQVMSLPRQPVPWSGQPGFCDPCVPGTVGVGVGTQHRLHSVRSCEPLMPTVAVAGGRPRGGRPTTLSGGAWG